MKETIKQSTVATRRLDEEILQLIDLCREFSYRQGLGDAIRLQRAITSFERNHSRREIEAFLLLAAESQSAKDLTNQLKS